MQWTLELQACFSEAVQRLGAEQAVPSNILEALGKAGVGLTLQVASTLPRTRLFAQTPHVRTRSQMHQPLVDNTPL